MHIWDRNSKATSFVGILRVVVSGLSYEAKSLAEWRSLRFKDFQEILKMMLMEIFKQTVC